MFRNCTHRRRRRRSTRRRASGIPLEYVEYIRTYVAFNAQSCERHAMPQAQTRPRFPGAQRAGCERHAHRSQQAIFRMGTEAGRTWYRPRPVRRDLLQARGGRRIRGHNLHLGIDLPQARGHRSFWRGLSRVGARPPASPRTQEHGRPAAPIPPLSQAVAIRPL